MIFNKNKTIKEITNTTIDQEHYNRIDKWKAIYAGYLKDWHDVKVNTINNSNKKRRKHSLNMAKVASEELAQLIFNEKVQINIDNDEFSENIINVLDDNRFFKLFTSKVEQGLALGGMVLKAHPKENDEGGYKLQVSYVTPDLFIPISWENGIVNEAAFVTITRKKDKIYCLFEFHEWKLRTNDDNELVKTLQVRNELYEGDDKSQGDMKKVPLDTLYDDLEPVVYIEGLTKPLFQYIKPAIANNFDIQSPLGISIFANALDTLYAIDTAFDSFIREFKLGKRRILVPAQAVRAVTDPNTGELHRYFDADDEVYEAFNYADPEKQKIMDNTVPLRIEEHISALNALLDIYSMQIGLSAGTFNFDGQSVKTATEVVSENSKTYQTVVANEEIIEEALRNFIYTLGEVAELYDIFENPEDVEIEFQWDDSIIKDKYTDSDFYIKLKNNGIISKKMAIMKILEVPEEEAQKVLDEINEEQKSETPDFEELIGGRE